MDGHTSANYETTEILQNDASWVKECQDNRVYLNTGLKDIKEVLDLC
jgi:hypothetical protein